MTARLLVANLDCELAWSRPGAPRVLPRAVNRRIAAAGALMAAFARDPGAGDARDHGGARDRLWTPEPVIGGADRLRRAVRAGAIGDVALVSGALADQLGAAAAGVLAWGETGDVARLRRRAVRDPDGVSAPPARAVRADAPWYQRLWDAWPDAAVARRVNDRRFAFALARGLGASLPGAAVLDSVAALEAHLASGGADAGAGGAWVVKAPQSASGRQRLRRHGVALDAGTRARARRLFAQFGELLFEPWMQRVADAGCIGVVWPEGEGGARAGDVTLAMAGAGGASWQLWPPHVLCTDAAGVFRGVTVRASDTATPPGWLAPGECARVTEVAGAVAGALAAAGYRGPFGIDAFVYLDARGARRLQPLSEINARVSFGVVAHAVHARLGLPANRALSLHIGDTPAAPATPDGRESVPLLDPAPGDSTCAWAEL